MTIEQIEKEIKESKKRQEFLLKELENLKKQPEFEKGKWYVAGLGDEKEYYLMKATGTFTNYNAGYTEFYTINGSEFYNNKCDKEGFKPATKEQIQKILIEVAKKKGFKNGVKINQVGTDKGRYTVTNFDRLYYYEDYGYGDGLSCSCGFSIYRNGEWAEIIKNDLPILNNKEGKIENNQVVYGCQRYNIEDVYNLDKTIKTFNITGNLNLNGYSITPSQIEKVVEYLNEKNL